MSDWYSRYFPDIIPACLHYYDQALGEVCDCKGHTWRKAFCEQKGGLSVCRIEFCNVSTKRRGSQVIIMIMTETSGHFLSPCLSNSSRQAGSPYMMSIPQTLETEAHW